MRLTGLVHKGVIQSVLGMREGKINGGMAPSTQWGVVASKSMKASRNFIRNAGYKSLLLVVIEEVIMASDKEQKEENSGKLESVVYTDASGTQTVDIAALFLDERVEEDRKKLKEIFQNQQSRTSHGKSTYNV